MPDMTGKNVTIAIRTIFGAGPIPSHKSKSGAIAIFGAVCRSRTSGVAKRSTRGSRTKTAPAKTPASVPSMNPATISDSVTHICRPRLAFLYRKPNLWNTSTGPGKRNAGTSKR
ncbi:hypothetical protein D3C71_1419300 [compost metagenome]